MSRPEVDNVPDLFQVVNETLVPNPIQGIKEASEHSTVSGQMERSETSANLHEACRRRISSETEQVRARVNRQDRIEGPGLGSLPERKALGCREITASRLHASCKHLSGKVGTSSQGGLQSKNKAGIPAQNTLSASVRDRTAQLATALDAEITFDGETYEPEKDRTRLKAQLIRVRELMRDGVWRSLSEISRVTGDPESSVSARLRDLRKPKFGLWTVDRRRRTNGLWEYRLGGKGI